MNRKIYLIGMMALAMLFASCKKEEKPEVQEAFSITASIEDDGSKTYLDPNSQNPADGYKVKWYVDDVIKVFGSTGDGVDFTCKTVESSGTEANFTSATAIDDLGEYWAFYPASAVTSLNRSNNTFTFTMDAEQTFKDVSSFADDLFPMAAHYPSGSKSGVKLQFKNAFGILKIHVTRNSPITKIVLTDNNSHALSGDFTFNPETKTTAAASNNSNVLTLNIPSNMQSGADAPTDFYMILPPGCLDGAFNLKFYNGSEVVKEIDKDAQHAIPGFAVERSKLKTANVDASKAYSFKVDGNGKKVEFSPGNLWYDGTWHFESNQYDCHLYDDDDPSKPRGLFQWSSNLNHGGLAVEDYPGNGTSFYDWGNYEIDGYEPNTWRTLTNAEWYYLFIYQNWYYKNINGQNGIVVFPYGDNDSYTTWENAKSRGAIFLPYAGAMIAHTAYWEISVRYNQHAWYYSCECYINGDGSGGNAKHMCFVGDEMSFDAGSSSGQIILMAVRLVKDAN